MLYTMQLERKVAVTQMCRKIAEKDIFQKELGQKLKINLLVG